MPKETESTALAELAIQKRLTYRIEYLLQSDPTQTAIKKSGETLYTASTKVELLVNNETIYAYVSAIWDTETDQSEYDVNISIYALYHLSITGLDELFRQLNENPEDVSHWINVSLFGSFFGYDHEGKPVYFNEHISDVALSTLPVHQAFQLLGYAQQTILPEFKHERTLAEAKAQDSALFNLFLT